MVCPPFLAPAKVKFGENRGRHLARDYVQARGRSQARTQGQSLASGPGTGM